MSDVKMKPLLMSSLIGAAVSIAASLILSMVVATLISNGKMDLEMTKWIGHIVFGCSALVGCMIAAQMMGMKKVLVCGLTLLLYLLLNVLLGSLLFGGVTTGGVLNGLAGFAGGTVACFLSVRKKSYKHRR